MAQWKVILEIDDNADEDTVPTKEEVIKDIVSTINNKTENSVDDWSIEEIK